MSKENHCHSCHWFLKNPNDCLKASNPFLAAEKMRKGLIYQCGDWDKVNFNANKPNTNTEDK